MHCINVMPGALLPGKDKGVTILVGGKSVAWAEYATRSYLPAELAPVPGTLPAWERLN